METNELLLTQKEYIEKLTNVLSMYRSAERKSKIILEVILVIGVIALFWAVSDLLGGIWGYILTLVIIGIGFYCIETLDISFRNAPMPNGKLAYQACIAMDALIQIKKGTYAQNGVHIICVSQGSHLSLYEQFIQLYPAFKCKQLKKLSKIETTYEDM